MTLFFAIKRKRGIMDFIRVSLNLSFLIYLILSALCTRAILEKRVYPSTDNKKVFTISFSVLLIAYIINFVFYLVFSLNYFYHQVALFFVLKLTLPNMNYIIFSIITFELLYEFYYLKTKISFENLKDYLIVVIATILHTVIVLQLTQLANPLILSILFGIIIYWTIKIINKNNMVMKY